MAVSYVGKERVGMNVAGGSVGGAIRCVEGDNIRVLEFVCRDDGYGCDRSASEDRFEGQSEGLSPVRGDFTAVMKDGDNSGVLVWKLARIENISTHRIYSPRFWCSGLQWRAVMYPRGRASSSHLACYLELCRSDGDFIDLDRRTAKTALSENNMSSLGRLTVAIRMTLINHKEESLTKAQGQLAFTTECTLLQLLEKYEIVMICASGAEGMFLYRQRGCEGGFDHIIDLSRLLNSSSGFIDCDDNDSIVLVVALRFSTDSNMKDRPCSLQLFTDADISSRQGLGLQFQTRFLTLPHISGAPLLQQCKELVASEVGIPSDQQQWFCMAERDDGCFRPCVLSDDLRRIQNTSESVGLCLRWSHVPLRGASFYVRARERAEGSVLVLFKFFETVRQRLHFVGSGMVPLTSSIGDIGRQLLQQSFENIIPSVDRPSCGERSDDADGQCYMYLEKDAGESVFLDPSRTVKSYGIKSGDIICFQPAKQEGFGAGFISDGPKHRPVHKQQFATADLFLRLLANVVSVCCVSFDSLDDVRLLSRGGDCRQRNSSMFQMNLRLDYSMSEVIESLAYQLACSPQHVHCAGAHLRDENDDNTLVPGMQAYTIDDHNITLGQLIDGRLPSFALMYKFVLE